MSSGIEERVEFEFGAGARVPGVGYSTSSDPAIAANEAIATAGARQPVREGDLMIVLVTADLDPDEFHDAALEAAAPASVVGCTTHGSFCDESQVTAGAVAAFVPADDARPAFETFVSGPGAPLNEGADTFNEKALSRPVGLPNARGRYEAREVLDATTTARSSSRGRSPSRPRCR